MGWISPPDGWRRMNPRWLTTVLFWLALAVGSGVPDLTGQVAPGSPPAGSDGETDGLPPDVAAMVTRRLEMQPGSVRVGAVTIPRDSTYPGDLIVLDGDARIAGSVAGDLLVINGTAEFARGATVGGDVLVIGGALANTATATIRGEITVYPDPFTWERVDGHFRYVGEASGRDSPEERDPNDGGSDFLVTTGTSYNRVEGLPIAFGPRIRTAGSNPFRLQALGIYRTESGMSLDFDRMGYFIRADQFIGGRQAYRVGATLHSLVDPIENWHVTDLETGLATFLFHRDYRDHFDRTGASLFAAWEPLTVPLIVSVEGRWERHDSKSSGSPWSLFRNAEPWRAQPIVAEGRLGSLVAQLTWDSRDPEVNPSNGWLIRGSLENGFHVDLTAPELTLLDTEIGPALASTTDFGRFLTAFIDARSYNRVDADSRLNFRLVAGGSLTGSPLPPQRQHALGGEGSLPGYSLFDMDCGARRASGHRVADADLESAPRFHPYYGCDAFALVQAEFRGKLSFRIRWNDLPWNDPPRAVENDEEGRELGWSLSPDWAIFVDAARAWSYDDLRPDEEVRVDAGAGIVIDRFGIYLAAPLRGGSGINLFVRLGPRF